MQNKLKQKITLIGSTGLIGSNLLHTITQDDCDTLTAITRRRIPNLGSKNFIKQSLHDFSDVEEMRADLNTDVLVITFGTTIKKAGSKAEFMRIDHDLPLGISKIAKEQGCRTLILLSSVGARSISNIFYNQTKGLLEESIEDIGFEKFYILRPSLLLGKREEIRLAEYTSKIILGYLSLFVPMKYRAIPAQIIAKNIIFLIRLHLSGKYVLEGKELFEINKYFPLKQ